MYTYKLNLRKGENNLTGIPNESSSFTSTHILFPHALQYTPKRERGSDRKESACNAGDLGLIPGSRRSPDEGKGYPLEYSCLENPTDRGAWWATVHGVAESRTQLSDWHSSLLDEEQQNLTNGKNSGLLVLLLLFGLHCVACGNSVPDRRWSPWPPSLPVEVRSLNHRTSGESWGKKSGSRPDHLPRACFQANCSVFLSFCPAPMK